jgi:predicted  nucleic acid-binding Zn-ribbon protein
VKYEAIENEKIKLAKQCE